MIGEGEFLLIITRVKWQVLVREDTNQNTERFGNPNDWKMQQYYKLRARQNTDKSSVK